MRRRHPSRRAAALGALTAAVVLAGCSNRADYAVDLRNRTAQPVYARLFRVSGDRVSTLAADRLGPGDRALLGPVRTRRGTVSLGVDMRPATDAPAQMPLDEGGMIIEVRQLGADSRAPLSLHVVDTEPAVRPD